MIERIQGNEESQAKEVARVIVDAIANGDYKLIEETADSMGEGAWTAEDIGELIENFKADNELDCFDTYDTVCKFNPTYLDGSQYKQENFYHFNDGSGFRYEYALTSQGELNDLTLMLIFLYRGDGIEVQFEDLHVL